MSINADFIGEEWLDPSGTRLTITAAEEELGVIWAVFGSRTRMVVYAELLSAGWTLIA